MSSLSVKNRVAMFEHGGNQDEEDREIQSPAARSFNRPSTPNSKPFKRENSGQRLGGGPATPNGSTVNESSKGNRASWPWPSEDNNIPAPKQEPRRISSPFLSNSDKPVTLPSPIAKSSGNTLKPKHIQNQATKSALFPSQTTCSPVQTLQKRFDYSTSKPVVLPCSPSRACFVSKLSKSGSHDENKAPRASEVQTQQSKTRQIVKSRNSTGTNPANTPTGVNGASISTEDDSPTGWLHSSNTYDLNNVASEVMSVKKDAIDKDASHSEVLLKPGDSLSAISLPGGKQSVHLTRSDKLSHAIRRVGVPDNAPDLLGTDSNGRSQSPLPAIRGTRTVSKVSHQEARKALLQKAQREKEKAEAAKEMKEKAEAAKIKQGKTVNDNSSKSQRGANIAADRLALKAANVLAIKNSSKILFGSSINIGPGDESFRDIEGSCSGSVVSASSEKRRMNHPAFAARSSTPVSKGGASCPSFVPEKNVTKTEENTMPFSEELFSSFRHFNESRPEKKATITPEQGQNNAAKTVQGRPPHPYAAGSPITSNSPKVLKDITAAGIASVLQNFDASPNNADGNTGRLSIDSYESAFMDQEESLHSTSDRNFDRRFTVTDATGNPKYAPPRQTFQHQEGGYLSSLSTNTHSTTSMISAANTPHSAFRIGTELSNPLGEMSPRASMRSGHSLAQSIISMSPRVEASKQNSDFEYLLNTPSGRETGTAGNATPSRVPPQIDEEEISESTLGGPSSEVATDPSVGSSLLENQPSMGKSATIPIQMSYSGAAEAPPGFVFHDEDTDGSEGTPDRHKIRDPAGRMSFDVQSDADKGDTLQDVRGDTVGKFSGSTSTKGTVSTSLRTGLSSVQNGASSHHQSKDHVGEDIHIENELSQRDGSKSIRSGLSGLQNPADLEESTSMRSVSVSMKSTAGLGQDVPQSGRVACDQIPQDPPQLMNPTPKLLVQQKTGQFPDTIVEGEDEEASGIIFKTDEKPVIVKTDEKPEIVKVEAKPTIVKPEEKSLLGQYTSTTDNSSRGSGLQSEQGSNGKWSDADQRVKTLLPAALAPIYTKAEKAGEDVSIASSPASSKHSRWKMKMPNVIKNVLSKASPRSVQTPKGKMTEKTGFSTSEDEDDDIFGGLEDDLSKVMGDAPKKLSNTMSGTGKMTTRRSSSQPPTQNRFYSGHSRKTEPPRINDIKERSSSTRLTVRSESKAKPTSRRIPLENKLSLKGIAKRLTSPKAAELTPYGLYSKKNDRSNTNRSSYDRSGTFVEQEVVQEVHSDITSSIIAGPFQKLGNASKKTPKKCDEPEDEIAKEKTPKAKTTKNIPTKPQSCKNEKTPKTDIQSVSAESKTSNNSKGKDTLLDGFDDSETKATANVTPEAPVVPEEKKTKTEEPPSMFMNLGCGLSDAYNALASVCHFGPKDEDEPVVTAVAVEDDLGTFISADTNNTSSHLTELEKRVWNEWDKLDSAFIKAAKSPAAEKNEDIDKKREVARGKLLEIANSAISSQMTKEGDHSRGSASYTTGSSSDSGDTGRSSGVTGSSSASQTRGSGESRSTSSGVTGMASDMLSLSVASKATATPILLSFSQRSLIEKFSKQLAHIGVEVLKLNRRKQWQVRYFTVSKERIALIAHEASSKSGAEVAQCPKALLWLKKFNAKGGGYSLANIDKSGHGGMLLVDLKDIHVSPNQDVESHISKKLAEKFKDSVLVTFDYQFKDEKRRIEFRCKDNDEAQFLCTCMRVIRDLLQREQALRQKTQKATLPKKL